MAPSLFLSYDSNSGPGQFGLGWSLSGVSAISRVNRTSFIDGKPASVTFDDLSDALTLDGTRLVSAPEGGRYLAKSVDDQTRVWRNGETFIARTRAGLTLYFGESSNSQIKTSGGKILTWALSRIEDTFGNQVVFLYTQRDGDWGIDKVFWTVEKGALAPSNLYEEDSLRTVAFASMEVRYDPSMTVYSSGFVGGELTTRSLLATRVTAFVGQDEYRRYDFEHQETNRFGGNILTSIRETGAEIGGPLIEYPKTEFTYTNFEPRWNVSPSYELPSDFGSYRSLKSGYRLVDLDGDGNRDVLYSAYVGGRSFRRAFIQDSSQWLPFGGLAPPIDFSSDTDETDPIFFFDADGDGKPELFSSRLSNGNVQATAHFQEDDSWKEAPGQEPPFIIVMDGQRVLKTFPTMWNTEPRLLTWNNQGSLTAWSIEQDLWESAPVSGWSEAAMPVEIIEGDFNCNGLSDLATLSADKRTLRFLQKNLTSDGGLELQEIVTYHASGEIVITKPFTRGACSSVAVAVPSSEEVVALTIDSNGVVDEQQIHLTDDQMARLVDIFPMDLDNQGQKDIAILLTPEASKPNISVFRFDQATSGWAHEGALDFLPNNAAEVIDASYVIAVEDINDDGRDDLLLLPAESGITTKALVNAGSGFELFLGFVPPIEFAREEVVESQPPVCRSERRRIDRRSRVSPRQGWKGNHQHSADQHA